MPRPSRTSPDLIQVVLDDGAVERLRRAAGRRRIDVEQLMVQLLDVASYRVDEILPEIPPALERLDVLDQRY